MFDLIAKLPDIQCAIWDASTLERLEVDADIGFDDPAETGQFFGVINSMSYVFASPNDCSVQVWPDFEKCHTFFQLAAQVSVVPRRIIPVALSLARQVSRSLF
jgi:hypothetical protein